MGYVYNVPIVVHYSSLVSICDIMAIFDENLRHLANVIHVTANAVFYSALGCMAAQVNREVDFRRASRTVYEPVPAQAQSDEAILAEHDAIIIKEVK
jgi:hypothetical protein